MRIHAKLPGLILKKKNQINSKLNIIQNSIIQTEFQSKGFLFDGFNRLNASTRGFQSQYH